MRAARRVGIQYGALPWRIAGRQVQVLLITSRGTQRWVIPKGWPINGLKPQDAAAVEASEEAGIVGEVEDIPIGSYAYVKQLTPKRFADVQVIVFAFRVSYQAPDWKERGERRFAWWPHQKAAQLVHEPGLRRLILDFGAARTPTLLAQSLWRYRTWRLATRS